ncbi:ectopic P granules protein 5-like protein [Dinothrombium tinctorium]|uniref:Ectopic P granules protein 5-like protein n=1 Tax=Dinothrombium tinctorium TaxID=1965070 RepID=A0A443R6N4_9ACAR|nr:ectopic P granules protein 5-like protein [Dinothrombium tinctorium]RWS10911.1 ectopic P granules protein 5-like protein [Dinothrombium tinctorium]
MSENISSDSYPLNGTQSVDKLKTIRPFTESQLLQLHAVNDLQDNDNFIDRFLRECRSVESTEFFQNIADLKRWRELLTKTRSQLTLITEECETVEHKVWELNLKNLKKRTRCADGRLVEGKHSYNEATLNKDRLKELEKNFQSIRNLVTNDYGNNFYNAQICQKVIENEIQLVVDENDLQLKNQKLKILISSLFSFQRYLEEVDSDFISLIKKWITDLVAVLLQDSNWEDHLFLLNHVLRCPGGVSSWATSFVQCKNPLLCADEAEAHLELNHCLIMISTILSPIKEREKFVGGDALAQNADVLTSSDDLWLMVDADVDEGEDVLINKLNLTETDIIRLLQQVPFEDILRYITRKPNMDESSASSLSGSVSHCQMSEIYMLKLLSISTKLIQILRQGLLTFNCMRFRTLTDYITSLIRKTVCAVSQFWQKCKRTVISEDQAMLLRLQVEYDHFILRSVVSILSSQRYGIWKFVSVIPFDGVTESMMWHIVWVFYNNGRDEIDELGGLCPYLSDAYWRAKFNEPAMKYLFQEKLPSLSASESECLLKSLANMIKSRSSNEIEFVNTIAVEMFEMGFLMSTVNDKMVKTCTELFAELSLQHPFFVSALIIKIRDSNCFNAQCIDLFEKMPLHLWIPEEHILHLLGDWLAKSALSTIFNRLSRLIISKMNWGLTCDQSALFFGIKYHRMMAIILYEAMFEQLKTQENLDLWNCCVFRGFDLNSLIYCAKSESKKHFVEFCWRICLILKLHLHNQPNWKKIPYVDFNEEKDENKFYPLPNINTDCDLLPIFKGLEIKNPLALYLTLMMTETGHSLSSYNANLELLTTLINEKNYIPALDVLQWFIPFYINKLEETLIDVKYIGAMNHLLLSEENEILKLAIGLIHYQFSHFIDIKKEIFTYWINLLCEILQVVLKQYSSSWFMASSKGLQQVTYLLDNIIMLMFTDDSFSNIVTDLLIQKTNEMQTLKLPSSGGWFSWGSHSRRSEWISPLHFMSDKAPDKVWFGWALIKSDVVKTEKIWEEILSEMNNNIDISVETAVKNVCTRMNAPLLPLSVLPINAWAKLAIDCPIDHVLMPLLWYNFFNCYFASIGTGGSMGLRVVGEALSKQLKLKLQTLIEHYHKLWVGFTTDSESESINDRPYANLTRLCRAFLLWLEDNHLHDAFVDVERLPLQYCTELLKSVMNNSESLIRNYVNEESLENQIQCFSNFWQEVKSLQGKITQLLKIISFFDFVNFSDIKPFLPPEYKDTNLKSIKIDEKELVNYKCSTILSLLQQHIRLLLEENKYFVYYFLFINLFIFTRYFDNRLTKLSNLNAAYIELLSNNYDNLRKELTLKIPCDKDGYDPDGCTGPGIITFEVFYFFNLIPEFLQKKIIAKKDLAEENEHILQSLVSFYLSSISDANNIVFAATKHVFNTLLEYLNFKSIENTSSNVLFVLLSKFDVNGWLKLASETECKFFLHLLGNALSSLNKNPAEDKLVVLGVRML